MTINFKQRNMTRSMQYKNKEGLTLMYI